MTARMPYDFVETANEDATGMLAPNLPSPEGAELGRHLARFCDQEEPSGAPPRCHDCAFRLGTIPNQCLATVANAFKCAMEGEPFFCHHGVEDGEPTRLCRGWIAMAPKHMLAGIAALVAKESGR